MPTKTAVVSPSSLANLYSDLNKAGSAEEFDRAIKVANKILSLDKLAAAAFHYKVVCYIQLGKFDDAVKLLQANTKLSSGLVFEKAYCQYRLNDNVAALATLDTAADTNSTRCNELRGQILYRLERYAQAHCVLRDVIKNTDDEFNDERQANLAAVLAQLQVADPHAAPLSQPIVVPLEGATYEQLYNTACRQLACGDQLSAAAELLQHAAQLCEKTLREEEGDEQLIKQELAIIHVQQAYCLQLLGRPDEAAVIYHDVLRRNTAGSSGQSAMDPAVVAVAANNTVVFNQMHSVFDSRKRLRMLAGSAAVGGVQKLPSWSRRQLAINQCVFSCLTNQGDQLERHLASLNADHSSNTQVTATLIRVAHMSRGGGSYEPALQLLKQQLSTAESAADRLKLQLAIAQLLMQKGDLSAAVGQLGQLSPASYSLRAGVVAARLALCQRCGGAASGGVTGGGAGAALLQQAIEAQSSVGDVQVGCVLLHAAVDYYMRHEQWSRAVSALQQLIATAPLSSTQHRVLTARLVVAYSHFDEEEARRAAIGLDQSSASATSSSCPPSDTAALETAGWAGVGSVKTREHRRTAPAGQHYNTATSTPSSPSSPSASATDARQRSEQTSRHARRRRRPRLPQNFNAAVPPDPERWLPRRQRASYRPRRRRRLDGAGGGGAAMRGTQGGPSSQSDLYDISKTAPQQKSPLTEAGGGAGSTPRPVTRNVQKKRKQTKRSGRW